MISRFGRPRAERREHDHRRDDERGAGDRRRALADLHREVAGDGDSIENVSGRAITSRPIFSSL